MGQVNTLMNFNGNDCFFVKYLNRTEKCDHQIWSQTAFSLFLFQVYNKSVRADLTPCLQYFTHSLGATDLAYTSMLLRAYSGDPLVNAHTISIFVVLSPKSLCVKYSAFLSAHLIQT